MGVAQECQLQVRQKGRTDRRRDVGRRVALVVVAVAVVGPVVWPMLWRPVWPAMRQPLRLVRRPPPAARSGELPRWAQISGGQAADSRCEARREGHSSSLRTTD